MSPKRIDRPLGDFECAVLLAVLRLRDDAYGVTIREDLERTLGRDVSFGAVYTTLNRLVEKQMLSTELGDPTPERGGRAKKFFTVERTGREALEVSRRAARAVWAMRPASRTR